MAVTDSEDRISIADALGELVRAGVGFIADLVSRIVNGIAGLVPVVVLGASGCSGPKVEPAKQEPAAVAPVTKPVEVSEDPKAIGEFDITFYYVIGEDEVAKMTAKKAAAANDNVAEGEQTLAAIAPPELVTIYEPKSCSPI